MISKCVNFFWGGPKLSWLRYMTLYSFCKLNPSWKVVLHKCDSKIITKYWSCPNKQDFFSYSGKDYFDKVLALNIEIRDWGHSGYLNKFGPSHLSNFFKWELMANEGGWYADMDILWVRPMEHLVLEEEADTVLCFRNNYFSIGLLASTGSNIFFKDVYRSALNTASIHRYQSAGVLAIYTLLGYKIIGALWEESRNGLDEVIQKYPCNRLHNLQMEVIYPWLYHQMSHVFELLHLEIPEATVGIHWYAGDSISNKYNDLMQEDTYKDFNNTFSYWAAKLLEEK